MPAFLAFLFHLFVDLVVVALSTLVATWVAIMVQRHAECG